MLLQVIGPPTLIVNEQSCTLAGNEAFALAYVALQPSGVSRQELAGLLWPHAPKANARQSLNQLLYMLRRKCGVKFELGHSTLRVDDLRTDMGALRLHLDDGAFSNALHLLPGRFLEGLRAPSAQLANWQDEMDSVLAQITSSTVHAALSTASDDELGRITFLCESALEHHPHLHSERLQLIQAVINANDLSRARRLHAELIADSDYHGDNDENSFEALLELPRSKPGIRGTVTSDARTVKFIGRLAELGVLAKDWGETTDGLGCTRVLWGEPGIGKTRLALQAMRRIALSGGRAWTVRCTAATQRLPFSVVRALVEDNDLDLQNVDPLVASVLGLANADTRQLTDGDHIRHVLVRALTDVVLHAASKKPLAILIDDAQWADDFTALLLAYWSYRLRGTRVLILLTARTHDVGGPPNWIMHELAGARHLTLSALTNREACDLVDAFEVQHHCTVRDDHRQTAVRQAGGVPFLLLETLAATVEAAQSGRSIALLPDSAELVLARRFQDLPSSCEWLVGLLAVVGQPVCAAEIAALSGMTDSETAAATTTLQRRGILEWANGALRFPHDLMRETAYRQLSSGTRALLHYRVAVLLAADKAPEGIIAQHYAASGDTHSCGRYAMLAANCALAQHLFSDAEYYYRMALESGSAEQRGDAGHGLLRLLLQLGRRVDVEQLVEVVPESAESATTRVMVLVANLENQLISGAATDDLVQHARVLAQMCHEIRSAGLTTASTTLLEIALDACQTAVGADLIAALEREASAAGDVEFDLQTQAVATIWEAISISSSAASDRIHRLRDRIPPNISAQTAALIESAQALIALYKGRLSEALITYERAIGMAEAAGDIRRLDALRVNWAVVCMEIGRFDDAKRMFEIAATSPKLPYRIRAYQNLAALHFELADYVLAEQAADTVIFHNRIYKSSSLAAGAQAIRGLCALQRADFASADKCLDSIKECQLDLASALDDNSYTIMFIARMAAVRNEISDAMEMLGSAAINKRHTDALCALRLECAEARLEATIDSSRGYARAKRALSQAQGLGATLIAQHAQSALLICDH